MFYQKSISSICLDEGIKCPRRHFSFGNSYSMLIPGGELPFEEYMGVCHELGSYFQEKIPKTVCQFFTKIPERAVISVRNSR